MAATTPSRKSGKSQTQRFHEALQKAGAAGITRLQFEQAPIFDGGPPILRVARCADDLRRRGIRVVSDPHGGTGNCAVYWLAEHAPVGVIRNDGKPDRAPEPSRPDPRAAGYRPVTFCHGCHTNRPFATPCPHGRRTETMLVSPGLGLPVTTCRREHVLAARHAQPQHQEAA